jgi:hypothetical protein
MRPYRLSALLAAGLVALGASPSLGRPICKPQLSVKQVRLSEVKNLQRTWTAVLDVDAARCAVDSGRFQISFVREKENAPELEFAEQFTWHAGEIATARIEVSIDLWIDEAVHDYFVYAAPCSCRD